MLSLFQGQNRVKLQANEPMKKHHAEQVMSSYKVPSIRLGSIVRFREPFNRPNTLYVGNLTTLHRSYFSLQTPSEGGINRKKQHELEQLIELLGRRANQDIIDPESEDVLCRSGHRITLEIAQAIRAADLLEVASRLSSGIRLQASAEDDLFWQQVDLEYDTMKDLELEQLDEDHQ